LYNVTPIQRNVIDFVHIFLELSISPKDRRKTTFILTKVQDTLTRQRDTPYAWNY